MTPVTDYDILTATSPSELVTITKTAIASGWIPVGPMTFTGGAYASAYADMNRNMDYMQTVVKASPTLANLNTTLSTISTNVNAIKTSVASIDSKTE